MLLRATTRREQIVFSAAKSDPSYRRCRIRHFMFGLNDIHFPHRDGAWLPRRIIVLTFLRTKYLKIQNKTLAWRQRIQHEECHPSFH